MSGKRALIAGVLSLVYPGLGHVYLGAWLRAIAWVGFAIATVSLVVPDSTLQAIDAVDIRVLFEATRTLPRDAIISMLLVRAFTVVDAAWLGLKWEERVDDDAAPACPECGGELDGDLDFCPWCTTPLDGAAEESRVDDGFH